jgi:hypothetical protein
LTHEEIITILEDKINRAGFVSVSAYMMDHLPDNVGQREAVYSKMLSSGKFIPDQLNPQ